MPPETTAPLMALQPAFARPTWHRFVASSFAAVGFLFLYEVQKCARNQIVNVQSTSGSLNLYEMAIFQLTCRRGDFLTLVAGKLLSLPA
jgi:hypothetical protein